MNKKQIKPARENLKVRKPDGEWLSQGGESLEFSAYWRRREAEGDVTITPVPSTPSVADTASTGKEK